MSDDPTRPNPHQDTLLAEPEEVPGRAAGAHDLPVRYALGGLLGQGGMGEVVLAVDQQIGREVAIKRIRAVNPSAEARARFLREARLQGRLEHPAVVPVHDLGADAQGRPFFVMKRLVGTDLAVVLERLRRGEQPDDHATRRRLLHAFTEVCLAIELAHANGVVHRDLKPANIMLGDYGEVYVLDWGIARLAGDDATSAPAGASADLALDTGATRVGTVLGTPAYMSPEQLAGDPAGPLSDVYALGCILYEIAAGAPLHAGARAIGAAFQAIEARPSQRRADAPPELDAICQRAVSVEPEARFPTARALGAAVQAYLDGDRDLARRAELAREHVAAARAALARGDAEAHRREAMSAAGRALALDPAASEAADLVSHLMLRPPAVPPVEVEARVAAIDRASARTQGAFTAASMFAYLGFLPLLVWSGARDLGPLLAYVGLALAASAQLYVLTRSGEISSRAIYANAALNALLIALIARYVGPFLIVPTVVNATLMTYAAHPRFGRIEIIGAILAAGVCVPWLMELAGAISPTFAFVDGALIFSSPLLRFQSLPVQLAFVALLVTNIALVAVLSRGTAVRQRQAQHQLETQAWHLRQILPTSVR